MEELLQSTEEKMKINIKIKSKIAEVLKYNKKETYCISFLSPKFEIEIKNTIEKFLIDCCYFTYKECATKYNDDLTIVPKNKIKEYFLNDYTIFSVDTLDILDIGYTATMQDDLMIEVYTTGKFNPILIGLKEHFKYDKNESRLPDEKI